MTGWPLRIKTRPSSNVSSVEHKGESPGKMKSAWMFLTLSITQFSSVGANFFEPATKTIDQSEKPLSAQHAHESPEDGPGRRGAGDFEIAHALSAAQEGQDRSSFLVPCSLTAAKRFPMPFAPCRRSVSMGEESVIRISAGSRSSTPLIVAPLSFPRRRLSPWRELASYLGYLSTGSTATSKDAGLPARELERQTFRVRFDRAKKLAGAGARLG